MIIETVAAHSIYRLRYAPEKQGGEKTEGFSEKAPRETTKDDGGGLLCRQCGRFVTSEHERIAVQGAHQHTFANPHGIVFSIGCFRSAAGCGRNGPLTTEWSWFKGFRWQLAYCRSCLKHLGWLFVSLTGERFHGLILDQLVCGRENGFGES